MPSVTARPRSGSRRRLTEVADLNVAKAQLDVLRKAQLIQNASGTASLADRRAVADRVMEILLEINLLEETESSD